MNPPETTTIKPEAKKVNVAAKSGKAAAAQTRGAEEARVARARIDQAHINKWVTSRIISWPPDNCFCCKRPIVYGAKWVELVNDNERARFHFDCAPAWRAEQEALAPRAMGLDRNRCAQQDPDGVCARVPQ